MFEIIQCGIVGHARRRHRRRRSVLGVKIILNWAHMGIAQSHSFLHKAPISPSLRSAQMGVRSLFTVNASLDRVNSRRLVKE